MHGGTRPHSWTVDVSLCGPGIGLAEETWGESGVVEARRSIGVGWGRGEQEWGEGKELKPEHHVGPRLLIVRVSDVNFCCCLLMSLSFQSEL